MYKKFTYDQIFETKTNFIKNLKQLYINKRYTYLKEFLRDCTKNWNCIYFFESNSPVFKIQVENDNYIMCDEKEKIQLVINDEEVGKLHRQLKDDKIVKKQINNNKTVSAQLFEEFQNWEYEKIQWKPFLVYDIETIGNINNLKSMKFMLAYSVISNQNHKNSVKYRIIESESIEKFVDFMISFDWWIVGYNNIYFDNPVSIYNSSFSEDKISLLNEKSLDLFLFVRNLTGKRAWLDFVSKSLLGISKTLDSWQEWENYLREYMQNWNQEAYSKVKSYCKNDVKMTLGVLLYFLKNNKISIWDNDFNYTINDLVSLWNTRRDQAPRKDWNNWIFDFDNDQI